MWYEVYNAKKELDYSRPIIAERRAAGHDDKYILLPQLDSSSFKVIGHNWFNLNEGIYNSCICWKTAL